MNTRKITAAVAVVLFALSACGGGENGGGTAEDQGSAAVSVAEGGPVGTVGGGQIPEEYPLNDFPVYEGNDAVILDGFRQPVGDMLTYNLTVGTNDAPAVVRQEIKETFEDRSTNFEMLLGGELFSGTIGQWQYIIVVSEEDTHGYATVVSYTLDRI